MKRLAVAVALALFATVAIGGFLWLKIRDERALDSGLQARIAALEAAPPPPAPSPARPPPPPPAPVVNHGAAAPALPQPAAPPADNSLLAQTKKLLSSPAGRDLPRAMLLQQYPDLGKELGLSEAQASNLLDVLARQQADVGMDSMSLFGGGPADPAAMQEVQQRVEDKQRANEAELASLLGDKYESWQQYQATAAARAQVTQLQGALGSANALTSEQSKALVASLATATRQLQDEQRNQPAMKGNTRQEVLDNQIKQAEESSHRMLDAASPHLTFPQEEIYKRLLNQQVSMMSSLMSMMGGSQGQGESAN